MPLTIDEQGVASGARFIASPNFDARPIGAALTLLVLHNISLPPGIFGGQAVIELFTNTLDHRAHPYFDGLRGLRVSTHFLIRRDGELIQLVACTRRAWHAGSSQWRGRPRCNDFSVGVELEGSDVLSYEPPQYLQLARLTRALRARYPLPEIAGHSDISPGRKSDPGPSFDWARYRADLAAPH
ncbi:MAG: 1,6-anhydro-N-acetylmuramyl-L-alanine amidase AmpD [Betaproteobacteria bacterium]|jgi:AmpD protein|nr:1,6-anhydro-N-acetylmuramyl-L-alanine amidase AmpD [Betaproteobacteria bacterium]